MNLRCLDLDVVKCELQAERVRTDQNRLQYQTELLRKRIKIASIKEQMRSVDSKLHAYSSALAQVQYPNSPPTYVLQRQALLCNAIHRMSVQARLVDKTKRHCTEIVRSVRQSMVDLEDECADIEVDMQKKIALLDEELVQIKEKQDETLHSQKQEIIGMSISLGIEEECEEDTILDIDSLRFVHEEESGNLETEFYNSLSRSLNTISAYFSHHLSTKEEEVVSSPKNPAEEPHSHFFDSFSDLKIEISPEKIGNNLKVGDIFHSLSNSLRFVERKLPEQVSAAPPVA
jgi:hypothetical protein